MIKTLLQCLFGILANKPLYKFFLAVKFNKLIKCDDFWNKHINIIHKSEVEIPNIEKRHLTFRTLHY